jgi:predicted transcriptional regulator
MPMSVRLDPDTESRIRRLARAAGKSKSWVVREAVAAYDPARQARPLADILAPFIGAGNTGRRDLSERTGDRVADLVRAKARTRRAR